MRRFYKLAFGSQQFEIEVNEERSRELAAFLFDDLRVDTVDQNPLRYAIICAGTPLRWSLWRDQKLLYFGESKHEIACKLMSEVVYKSIEKNDTMTALHGAAVHLGDSCIVLPGSHGSGKSTLVSWLALKGYRYLTDELVLLSADGVLTPFTRPVSLSIRPGHPAWPLEPGLEDHLIQGDGKDPGALVPHRLLNDNFVPAKPLVTHFVFPEFKSGSELRFEELTPAQSLLFLLQSHANVRILPDHGMPFLSALVRRRPSYRLVYDSFKGLESFFDSLVSGTP